MPRFGRPYVIYRVEPEAIQGVFFIAFLPVKLAITLESQLQLTNVNQPYNYWGIGMRGFLFCADRYLGGRLGTCHEVPIALAECWG